MEIDIVKIKSDIGTDIAIRDENRNIRNEQEILAGNVMKHESIKNDMINCLAEEKEAFLRYQQIDEPDFTVIERKKIIEEILQKSNVLFLNRFGKYLKLEHLIYFDEEICSPDDAYEMNSLLNELKRKLNPKRTDNKNRRYFALRKMIKNGDDYFSEKEMIKREPSLYQELVGQYLTDNERSLILDQSDYDESENQRFSFIKLNSMDRDHIKELLGQHRYDEENDDDDIDDDDNSSGNFSNEDVHKDGIINDEYYPQVPPSFRKHWGDFEDDTIPSCSNSLHAGTITTLPADKVKIAPKKRKQTYIKAEQKEALKTYFNTIMHTKFVYGQDKEYDYSLIDDDPQYDDIITQDQDCEDRYFDSDSLSEIDERNECPK